jgi:hypothetical protein
MEYLFSGVNSSYYNLEIVLTQVLSSSKPSLCHGLEVFAVAAPPLTSSCKSDLDELDHVVEILVKS